MKKFNVFLVIIVCLLALGMAACASVEQADSGGSNMPYTGDGSGGETTPQPKFLTITGVPAGQNANLGLSVYGVQGRDDVASATVWLADLGPGEHDITYSIHVGDESHDNNAAEWTGSGEYVIWIDFFQTREQSSKKVYYYDGGKGDVNSFTFTDSKPSQTIPWSQFEEVWW